MGFWLDSFLTELLVSVIILLVSFVVYVKWIYNYWNRHNIMQLEPVFLLGNTGDILLQKKSIGQTFKEMYDKFKAAKQKIGGFYFALGKELLILDLDIIKSILIKDAVHFIDRGNFSNAQHEPLTGNLFQLDGPEWKHMRTKLTPTFTSGKMKMMFSTLVACSDELKVIMKEKSKLSEPINIKDILARFTTDVIGSCAFGIDCNCLKNPNTDFRKYGEEVFEPSNKIDTYRQVFAFAIPNIWKFFNIRQFSKEASDFFYNVVQETVKYREENNLVRKDFMQLLIQLKNQGQISNDNLDANVVNGVDSAKKITLDEVAAQSFVFFLAGFETSSTTMTFCLYELSKNQEVQDKARKEIQNVLKKHDGKLTYEGIQEMKYLEQVINETLRKYPALPLLIRECTKDYKIPNIDYVIKKKDHLKISILGIQRNPEFYPDPEKFDPERFSETEKSKRHPLAFIPFGEGPRICIGLRFGVMQSKVGLAVLLKDYKFTLNSKTKVPLKMKANSVIMSTVGGIWLDAHKIL